MRSNEILEGEIVANDVLERLHSIKPTRQIIRTFPSGTMELELGADGVWLRFDCDCVDALPYCQAQCCALIGTIVFDEEVLNGAINEGNLDIDRADNLVMKRGSDGFCRCLNRQTRTCEIYENRPQTCKDFHCTRGADMRGWPLPNYVKRQAGG
ncbi:MULTISPECIES: YkgJ family cysteine cluster protein [Aerosakkonema]|uniref:YkgJ family cysteine cluster protein n=1 Tax=Aerosakkonema TaxID=1246629 RepID=UPI0035B7AB5A